MQFGRLRRDTSAAFSCRFGHLSPGSAFAAARPMARSMRDREIIRNGECACADVIQLAPVSAQNGKVEKGGAWLEFSSDHGHGRSGA